eukprot:scaffold2785_cov291-Pinguiococcus_pyrenoidosus.AAC.1
MTRPCHAPGESINYLLKGEALHPIWHANVRREACLALLVDVDVLVQVIELRLRTLLRLDQRLLDVFSKLLLHGLALVGGGHVVVNEDVLDVLNGILGLAVLLDLLAGTIRRARIGHGVPVVAIRVHLHEHGPVPAGAELADHLHALLDRQHVHAVNLEAGNVVAHGVVVDVRRAALRAGAHAILVVLDAQHQRKAPQGRHVRGLEHLALVRRAVSEHRDGNRHLLAIRRLVLLRKSQASAHRNLESELRQTLPSHVPQGTKQQQKKIRSRNGKSGKEASSGPWQAQRQEIKFPTWAPTIPWPP